MRDQAWTEEYCTVQGIRLHIVEQGTGPLVILLHGFPQFWYAWHHQIPVLADAGYHVVAPDLRGFNLSEKPRGVHRYTMQEVAGDIAELIRKKGGGEAVVIGHDIGGALAWAVATLHTTMVKKLVVLNTPHPANLARDIWTYTQMRKLFYCILHQLPLIPECVWRAFNCALVRYVLRTHSTRKSSFPPHELQLFINAAKQPGALRGALNYYRALRIPQGSSEWMRHSRRIDTPVLVLWGDQERILMRTLLDGMDQWAPNLRIEYIANAGHWIQEDAPDEVNRSILEFLRTT